MSKKYICNECNEELIYCHGEIIRPYLRHKSKSLCKSNGGESVQHKFAKTLIKEYLEMGKMIDVFFNCDCYRDNQQLKLNNGETVIEEYKNGSEVYDIAILDNGEIKHIIDVYHTHRQKRANFFEFSASDIIENLNEKGALKDIKCYCENCDPSIIRKNIGILAKKLNIGYIDFNLKHFIIGLGLIDKLWSIAINGKCLPFTYEWNLCDFEYYNDEWNKLLSYRKCVRCLRKTLTSKFKPYCLNCYRNISNGNEVNYIIVSHLKERCRIMFNKIIKSLPSGEKQYYDLCKLCNKNHNDNLFCWHLSDKMKYKHICYQCLYNLIDKEEFTTLNDELEKYLMDAII